MRRGLLTVASILAVGSLACVSTQAAPTASRTAITADSAIVAAHYTHAKRTHRHAVRPTSEITSFSSSSGLNVGVNHPAKK
jgi:predicted lysophospholipase L1 biosynthesis ABC-type transport system permease subunit